MINTFEVDTISLSVDTAEQLQQARLIASSELGSDDSCDYNE